MKKVLLLIGVYIPSLMQAQCSSCYSIENALVDPSRVKELVLVNKGLTEIPEEISRFSNLEYLNLSQNQLLAIDDRLSNNLHLTSLDLSHNTGLSLISCSDSFFDLPMLRTLNLSHNYAAILHPALGKMKSLESLYLANNSFRSIPQSLAELPQLKILDLANNGLEEVHQAFADLWQLNYLDISGNFKKVQYETMNNLKYKDKLKVLRCSLYDLNKQMATCMNTTGIEELIIVDSRVGKFHGAISKNKTIRKITFENSTLADGSATYRRMNAIPNLNELTFVQTAVDPAIKDMNRLKTLTIENSDVSLEALAKNSSIADLALINNSVDMSLAMISAGGKRKELNVKSGKIPVSSAMLQNRVVPISQPEPSRSRISAVNEAVIEFEDTRCVVEKETFLTQDGERYTGQVTVEVTEFFDPVINALAGAPMTARSPSGSNEIFASNGMFSFSAKDDDGNELKIDPEKPVQITIRDVQPTVPSTLFSFQPSINSWNTVGAPVASSFDSLRKLILDSLNALGDNLFVNLTSIEPFFYMAIAKSRKDPYQFRYKTPKIQITRNKIKQIGSNLYYYNKREDTRFLMRKTWMLDTVVTDEMSELFKEINERRLTKNKFRFNGMRPSTYSFFSDPRLIKDVRITPDLMNDNYRMTLSYKGQELSYPVYFEAKGSLNNEITKQKLFYKKYSNKLRKHEAFQSRMEKRRADIIKRTAAINRRNMATFMTNTRMGLAQTGTTIFNTASDQGRKETLSFGIDVSGLYNCDYFYRLQPDSYASLPDTLYDQHGKIVETPDMVRYIVVDDNAYFEISRLTIPVYKDKKSLVIMVLGAFEIAVITAWETINDRLVPVIKRINTEGKAPKAIRHEIFKP